MQLAKTLLLFASGAFSLSAGAGLVQNYPVTIDAQAGVAYATLAHARYSSTRAFLECSVANQADVVCTARDEAGTSVRCIASAGSSPSFVKNVSAINSASFVAFYWNPNVVIPGSNGAHPCIDLGVGTGSLYLSGLDISGDDISSGVLVDNVRGRMEGSLNYARRSRSPVEYLKCEVWAGGSVYCWARDQHDTLAQCNTHESQRPKVAEAVRSMDDTSTVQIRFDPTTLVCIEIDIDKGSQTTR